MKKKRKYQRKIKIPKPELQWRIMTVFAILAMASAILQSIALGTTLVIVADHLPNDGNILHGKIEMLVWVGLAATMLFILPLNLFVGRAVTFKFAGPLFRFEAYLRQIIAGERPGPVRIRKDDELQDFCVLLNEAIAPLSAPLPEEEELEEGEVEEPEALLPGGQEVDDAVRAE
jgi:hypothetical protein